MLIYLLVYFILIQNMGNITALSTPVELIDIKAGRQFRPANTPSAAITEPPIDMDDDTRTHLEKFRREAAELSLSYPQTFISRLPTGDKKVALTFDDGPDSRATMRVLDILEYYDIPATFFMIGQNIDRHMDVVYRAIQSGHEIANHSWSHLRPTSISVQELINEAEKTRARLVEMGIDTHIFRPPYGLITPRQMEALKALGYRAVIWSIDSMDWYTSNPQEIAQCVISNVHPGAIILMHCAGGRDNRSGTIEALPMIISALKREGYEFVTIQQLIDF